MEEKTRGEDQVSEEDEVVVIGEKEADQRKAEEYQRLSKMSMEELLAISEGRNFLRDRLSIHDQEDASDEKKKGYTLPLTLLKHHKKYLIKRERG